MNIHKHLTSIPKKALRQIEQKNKKLLWGGLILILITFLLAGIIFFTSRNPKEKILTTHEEISIVEDIPEEPKILLPHYIEIVGGCNWAFEGTCINLRSGAGLHYPALRPLRMGMVFRVEPTPVYKDGYAWYRVIQDSWLSYPKRVEGDWYIANVNQKVRVFENVGDLDSTQEKPVSNKRIIVSISEQKLRAYTGSRLFMKQTISTGVGVTGTEVGEFNIFRKTPSRYMQGPLPGASAEEQYDLPAVPWDLYYSADGSVIHGAYWHNNFGQPMSHGCINQSPENAKKLYEWADLGTKVIIEK
jgi:hypothetical protein